MVEQTSSRARDRFFLGLLGATVAFLVVAVTIALWQEGKSEADPSNVQQVTLGKSMYARHCAACHGASLEGQPNWKEKLPSGRIPAPPHDASGHTWHHPDAVLFGITKHGVVPGKFGPPGYQSDMPAFGVVLSDKEIWAVLAYIKSVWPEQIRRAQADMTRGERPR